MKSRYTITVNENNYNGVFVTDSKNNEVIRVNLGSFEKDYDLVREILQRIRKTSQIDVMRTSNINRFLVLKNK